MKSNRSLLKPLLGSLLTAVLAAGAFSWWRTRTTPDVAANIAPAAPAVTPTRWRELELAELRARQSPNDAAAALDAGAIAGELNRFADALGWFRRAEALDRTLLPAITGQGQMWLALGRPGRAAEYYERALKAAPGEPLLLMELSRTYSMLRDFPEALRYARQAAGKSPNDPAAYRTLSTVYGELVLVDESLKNARRACELAPDDAENWVLLGTQLLRGQKYGEAETAFRKALALRPDSVAANQQCARALIEGRKTPAADREAFGMLTRARMVDPGNGQVLLLMGGILTRAGSLPLAVSVLRQAREAAPRDPAVLLALGQALIKSQKGEEGVRMVALGQQLGPRGVGFLDLEELARKNPSPALALRLADLYQRQELYDQAVRVLERAVLRKPGDARLTARLRTARADAARLSPPGL